MSNLQNNSSMFFLGSVILVPIGGARHAFPILWNTLQVQSERVQLFL